MYGFNWNSMGGEYRAYSFILKGFVTTCSCGSSLTFPSKITKLPQLITVSQTACFLFPIGVSVWYPEIEIFQCFWVSLVTGAAFTKNPELLFTRGECHSFDHQVFLQNFFSKELWMCCSYVLNSWFPCLWLLSSFHKFH